MNSYSKRGSGRTTKQLREAPEGAIFVVRDSAMKRYVEGLARHLGVFGHLKFRTAELLDHGGPELHGTKRQVVVDHAVQLNDGQYAALREHMIRLKERVVPS